MTLTEAQRMADDVQAGNVHLYTVKEMQTATDVLWSASRVDYNRLDALEIGIAAANEMAEKRLRNR